MSIKRILVLALLLVAGASMLFSFMGGNQDSPKPEVSAVESPSNGLDSRPSESGGPKPAPPPTVAPPAAETIPVFPDPGVEESDAQSEKEQVDAALAQISSNDPAQRIEGAEQLGAYPTKEAETALTQLLSSDSDPEVRSTAAQNLGYVERPSDTTLGVLLNSLEDQNEEVRLSALSTLEDFLLGSEEGSKRYTKLLTELQSRAASQTIPEETREAINDVLQDQANPTQ